MKSDDTGPILVHVYQRTCVGVLPPSAGFGMLHDGRDLVSACLKHATPIAYSEHARTCQCKSWCLIHLREKDLYACNSPLLG